MRRVALARAERLLDRLGRPVSRECAPPGPLPKSRSAPSGGPGGRIARRRLCAVNSSLVARNNFVRKHCKRVRQASSPGSADRSELTLCVATIGMRRACRDKKEPKEPGLKVKPYGRPLSQTCERGQNGHPEHYLGCLEQCGQANGCASRDCDYVRAGVEASLPNYKAVPTCVTSSVRRRETSVTPETCSEPVAVPSSSAEKPTCVLIEMRTRPNSVRRVNQSVSSP